VYFFVFGFDFEGLFVPPRESRSRRVFNPDGDFVVVDSTGAMETARGIEAMPGLVESGGVWDGRG